MIAPPMLVRDGRTSRAVGLVKNHALAGGVVVFVIYLDPELSRPGYGVEAIILYLSHLFDSGARLVMAEILAFNSDMIRVMTRVGIKPQARLREHVYVAGQFHDMIVYSFGLDFWRGIVKRYRSVRRDGRRGMAAFGASRPPTA